MNNLLARQKTTPVGVGSVGSVGGVEGSVRRERPAQGQLQGQLTDRPAREGAVPTDVSREGEVVRDGFVGFGSGFLLQLWRGCKYMGSAMFSVIVCKEMGFPALGVVLRAKQSFGE